MSPRRRFFRPNGGGIIEAGRCMDQQWPAVTGSSARMGAASLKPRLPEHPQTLTTRLFWFFRPNGGGIIEARESDHGANRLERRFFRPNGGGIIEALFTCAGDTVVAAGSSARMGAASLKPRLFARGLGPGAGSSSAPMGSASLKLYGMGGYANRRASSSARMGAASLKR